MITVLQALKWLNKVTPSPLSGMPKVFVSQIRSLQYNDPQLDVLIKRLFECQFDDRLAFAEALLTCAGAKYYWGDLPTALDYVNRAAGIYRSDRHRQAVALWIKGILERETGHFNQSWQDWNRALELFKAVFFESSKADIHVVADWYWESIKQMQVDKALTLEEAEAWFNQFRQPDYGEPMAAFDTLAAGMQDGQRSHELKNLLGQMNAIAKKSTDYRAEAQIKVHGAILLAQLNETGEALKWISEAVRRLPPDSHEQHTARWIYGSILVQGAKRSDEAVAQWRRAIEGYDQLAVKADYQNDQQKRLWYLEKRDFMSLAFERAIPGAFKSSSTS